MKPKRSYLFIPVVVLIMSAALISLHATNLFARKGSKNQAQQAEGNAPAKTSFIDVVPVSFHPAKRHEIAVPDGEALNSRVSPDGSRIVCVVKRDGKSSLAVAELPAGSIATLPVEMDDVADPAWNADGTQIVFAGTQKGVAEIYLYNMKAKKLTQVTHDPARKKSWPRCSPYRFGKEYRIAYTSEEKARKVNSGDTIPNSA